jgi:arsenate reductase
MKQSVLFLCTHNSSRSQIAEGLVNHFSKDDFEAFSAGTIATKVNPFAVKVMKELGVNIKNQYSKSIEEFRARKFDHVVTVCDNARESCPFFPGDNIIHKSFADPAAAQGSEEEKLEAFRKVRDEILAWLKEGLPI